MEEHEDDGKKERAFKNTQVKKIMIEAFHMMFYVIIVFITTFLIIHFIGQRTQVSGHSMENTLFNHDSLIVDKLSYKLSKPKRFDIIVFPAEESSDIYYIKRIIGLPGETVQIMDGRIYINNELLNETFGKEEITEENEGIAIQPVILGEDEYFVLGDNRNHSKDSRDADTGNIKKSQITGKAWIRIWPLKRFGFIKHS